MLKTSFFTKVIYLLILVLSFSSCKKYKLKKQKKKWITNAFEDLRSNKYPRVKAISWWNENFDDSKLRIDGSKKSLKAYRKGVSNSIFVTCPVFDNQKLISPNGIYHSAYPDFGGTEDQVTSDRIAEFENLAEKDIVWAYFSNNWYNSIHFPSSEVSIIHNSGKVPFIRMMPRTDFDEGGPDENYTMQNILAGNFDSQLTQWAIDASNLNFPILVEFGTEVNGNWFPWNGEFNGGNETSYGDPNLADGPERFRDAYRHIIDICNANGADNITWFFHVDAYSSPETDWNIMENYYPGDNYIDWLGLSVYGPQEAGEEYQSFSEIMDDAYPSLANLSNKPIAILEFAITE